MNDEGSVSSFSATDKGFYLQFCIKPAICSASSGANDGGPSVASLHQDDNFYLRAEVQIRY